MVDVDARAADEFDHERSKRSPLLESADDLFEMLRGHVIIILSNLASLGIMIYRRPTPTQRLRAEASVDPIDCSIECAAALVQRVNK